jgi:phospholipid/cholesterol/gamma-HCH transport system ATP-binding protein
MAARIELKDVTNRFGKQVVHDGVNLTLDEGEILGLVGGSGSGKSVLLRTILGLNRPQKGKVLIDGTDIYAVPPEERLRLQKKWGVSFQNGALFSGLDVIDNVALPMREHTDLSPGVIQTLAFLKLGMVGLDKEAANKMPSALSGGMITRAAMARAMALDPGILFLDEPTGALDPVAASSLDELMLSMQKILALTILIITHDPITLVTVCDRVAMIADKKVEVGTIDDLLKSSNPKIKEYLQGQRMQAALSKRKKGKV